MENYFHYFSEIEERFQRRRGSVLLLSTLDWALIETWKESGIPLEAVLRGIDDAFDSYDRRPRKTRKINSLAYCTQAVMAAAEEIQEAALGATRPAADAGIQPAQIAAYLANNARLLQQLSTSSLAELKQAAPQIAGSLLEMAKIMEKAGANPAPPLEEIERRLSVLEEKLLAALISASSEEQIVLLRAEADREMAPYRSQMQSAQIAQLQKQFVNKRLLERHGIPRLSLFYMQ